MIDRIHEHIRLNDALESACDDALDDIYSSVDNLFRVDAFDLVDEVLSSADVYGWPVLLLLGFASITSAASEHLPSRSEFMAAVRERLTVLDPERVDALLAGLE